MNVLTAKLKEVLYAVLPITLIVLLLHFTLVSLEWIEFIRFLIGSVLIIIGLSIFLFGVDIGITPIGQNMGKSMAKSNRLWIIITGGLLLGFFISIAEPDLHILAGQVEYVSSGQLSKVLLVIVVSIGIGALIAAGLSRIVYNFPLYQLLTILYGIIFALALFTSPEFLAISFDASGATTGALTVPFILALAYGVSAMKKDSKDSEKDSFGLIAIASSGAIIAVMIMNILFETEQISGTLELVDSGSASILAPFWQETRVISQEITMALLPILITYLIFQNISFKMSRKSVRKIIIGLLFTFIGLVLFLVGVNAGFMDVGRTIGQSMASFDSKAYVVLTAFALGLVTILAEPAVHVLTQQIEEVTSGYVGRNAVLLSLSIGVGIAVALSILRILIPEIQLWHYLLPGYIIAIIMSYIAPKLFVGIGFDSGGVASGPMTATFILAFTQGAASAIDGADVLIDGFGMIAMVALTPVLALQVLGLIFKLKSKKGGLVEDAQS